MLSRNLASKEVTCVHLYAWLVGVLLKKDTCLRRVNADSELIDVTCCVEYPVVVITVTENKLVVVLVDILSDSLRSAEIERSSLYRTHLTTRNELVVCRSEDVRVHIKNLVCSLYSVVS